MKKTILYFFVLLSSLPVLSQQKKIGGYINNDITFYSDTTYFIESNTRISRESELIIMPNVRVLINSGVSVIIDGSLKILGEKNRPVKIQSFDKNLQALGLIISGYDEDSVIINHCEFSKLLLPIRLKDGWFRNKVSINYCVFKDIHNNQFSIYFGDLSKKNSSTKPSLFFTNNSFIENNSTINISNFESDELSLIFKDNLITSNYIIDSDTQNPLNAVFSGTFNQNNFKNYIVFEQNSIFDNFLIPTLDYTTNSEQNIGISGEGESFVIKNNFIGEPLFSKNTLVHFNQNNNLPNIELKNLQEYPSENLPPHIWKVKIKVNDAWINWKNYTSTSDIAKTYDLKLFFNKPITIVNSDTLNYFVLNEKLDTLEIVPFYTNTTGDSIQFSVSNINLHKNALLLPTAIDNDAVFSPKKMLGNFNLALINEQGLLDDFLSIESINNETISKPLSNSYLTKDSKVYTLLAGSLFGSHYFIGDATHESLDFSYGTFLSYVFNDFIELQSSYKYSSTRSKFPSNYLEDVGLKTDINSLSFRVNYNLFNFSDRTFINFFLGLGLLNFQVKGDYQGFYYDLKNLQTEGTDYSSITLFTPLGITIKKDVFKDFFIALELGYDKTFSDYLDDISGSYADYNSVLIDKGEVAAYFSDPSRINSEFDFQKSGNRGNSINSDNLFTVLFSIGKKIK